MNSRYFTFNGEKSIDKGFHIFNFEQEFYEISTYGGRSIEGIINQEGMIQNHKKTNQPLTLTFNLVKISNTDVLEPWTQEDRFRLADWLITDNYKELSFGNDVDRVYFAMVTEISPLMIDRVGNGYVTITMTTNASHAWTRLRVTEEVIKGKSDIEIISDASIGKEYDPIVYITPLKNGDLIIKNRSNNKTSEIKDLRKDELVIMNNKYKYIVSEDKGKNVFKNFNREWLSLRKGSNLLHVEGECIFRLEVRYPIL